MKRDFAGAVVGVGDFVRLASACRFDHAFPTTYADWQALVEEGAKLAQADGRPIRPIEIDVGEFERWAALTNVRPGLDTMRAFLIVKRFGVADALDNMGTNLHDETQRAVKGSQ
jgi:hypothetical protein